MSVQLGIYDFFARIIPGGLYIIIAVFFLNEIGLLVVDFYSISLSVIQLLVFTFAAYILGSIMDFLAVKMWARFFTPKSTIELEWKRFKNRYNLDAKLRAEDWTILFAYVKKEKTELAETITKNSVTQVMLRNISFGLLLFAILLGALLVQNFSIARLIYSIISFFFSIIAMNQSVKFRRWFYSSIFQAFVACSRKPSDFISEDIDTHSKNSDS